MNTIYLSVGGFTIKTVFVRAPDPSIRGINNLPKQIKTFLKPFIVDGQGKKTQFVIRLIVRNIIFEKTNKRDAFLYFFQEKHRAITSFAHISINQFIFLVLYTVQKLLVHEGGFFFHGSSVEINKKAVIFTGRPGAGKSTIARLLGKKHRILADDSMIIRKQRGAFYLYQTPFIEKNRKIVRNFKKYEIDRVIFIRKDKDAALSVLHKNLKLLLRLVHEVWSQDKDIVFQKKSYLDFFNVFCGKNRFFLLKFPKKQKVLEKLF